MRQGAWVAAALVVAGVGVVPVATSEGEVLVTARVVPDTLVRLYDRTLVVPEGPLRDALGGGLGLPLLDDPQLGPLNGIAATYLGTATADATGRLAWTVPAGYAPADGGLDLYAFFLYANQHLDMRDAYGTMAPPAGGEPSPANDETFRAATRAHYDAQPQGGAYDLGDLGQQLDDARHDAGEAFLACEALEGWALDDEDLGDYCGSIVSEVLQATGYAPAEDLRRTYRFYADLTGDAMAVEQVTGANVPRLPVFWPILGATWTGLYGRPEVYLAQNAGTSTLWHEHGHDVQYRVLGDLPDQVQGNHGGCAVTDLPTAWAEGWAEFYADAAAVGFVAAGDLPKLGCPNGAAIEGNVRAIFIDLLDGPGDDPVDGDLNLFWNVLAQRQALDIHVFAQAWFDHHKCQDPALAQAIVQVAALNGVQVAPAGACV